jgi:hypothetical protein
MKVLFFLKEICHCVVVSGQFILQSLYPQGEPTVLFVMNVGASTNVVLKRNIPVSARIQTWSNP